MLAHIGRRELIWLVIIAALVYFWRANRPPRLEKIANANTNLVQLQERIVQLTPKYPEVSERAFVDYNPPAGYNWDLKPIILGDTALPALPPFSAQPPNLLIAPLPLRSQFPSW